MYKRLIPLMLALFAVASMQAVSPVDDLPVVNVNGSDYHYYYVNPGETIFSISQKLGMTRDELVADNPTLADGLQAYTYLYFPVAKGDSAEKTVKQIASPAESHKVKGGETLYGISKTYGISVDDLIAANPSARDGIRSGDSLVIPSKVAPKASAPVDGYEIKPGETLYHIASAHGITVEDLLRANPNLNVLNYSAGTVITIPTPTSAPDDMAESGIEEEPNPVAEIRTTTMDLQPVNDTPRLIVPVANAEFETAKEKEPPVSETNPVAEIRTTTMDLQPVNDTPRLIAPTANAEVEQATENETAAPSGPEVKMPEKLEIAVMLPFMLDQTEPGRQAELLTDFYRGFLLAADSLSHSGTPVIIRAFDTKGSLDRLQQIATSPEVRNVNLVIAPGNEEQIDWLAANIDEERAFILNPFSVKNEAHRTNAHVIQTNIPHDEMYERAINAFIKELGDRTPVFLSRISGNADKDEFLTQLKARLDSSEIPYKSIAFQNVLNASDLDDLSVDGGYVFMPVSSQRNELIKLIPSLKRFAESMENPADFTLFGYPEWLTLRGDLLENLQELNAVVYSRFYDDENSQRSRNIKSRFRSAYGRDMIEAVPSQALLGFDIGMFVINALRDNGGDFHLRHRDYKGVQQDFTLDDADIDGLVNTSLKLVKFSTKRPTRAESI